MQKSGTIIIMNKTGNKFFQNNTIQSNIPTVDPLQAKRGLFLRRQYSSTNTKISNPSKFVHRETFTNKMYPKMFNIEISKMKNQKHRQNETKIDEYDCNKIIEQQTVGPSFKSQRNTKQIKIQNGLSKTQQLLNSFLNNSKIKPQQKFIVPDHWQQLKHHLTIFQTKISQQGNRMFIKHFKQIYRHIEDVIFSLTQKLINEKYEKINIILADQEKQSVFRRSLTRTQSNKKYRALSSSITVQDKIDKNPLLNSIPAGHQFQVPYPPTLLHKTQKSMTDSKALALFKNIQFQNQKLNLLSQHLRQQIHAMNVQLSQQRKAHDVLQKKYLQIKQKYELSEYRINKLKEELEVAHVIKDQNLEDKMKFIFTMD